MSVVLAASTATAVADAEPVSPGFFGVVPQAPLTPRDFARMRGVVKTIRMSIYWPECEPAPGEYNFRAVDRQVSAAAAAGIRVQPFVNGTPSWLAAEPARPPLGARASRAWSRFLRAVVRRYGSRGEFWTSQKSRMPMRQWQVWNEPNFALFWRPWPSPAAYARLLRISARAIRAADPRAKIVLGGVAPVRGGIGIGVFLRRLFRLPGVRHSFDIAAVHPYASSVPGVEYRLREARRAMVEASLGSRPLLVTEIGVASLGDYPSAFVEGPDGQAAFLKGAYTRLIEMRRRWRIAGIDWFTWQDALQSDPQCAFCQGAGLVSLSGRFKPAWWAFREVVRRGGLVHAGKTPR
ncbi:MAG TPA: hypothetical protein VIM28_09715 [Solirubrobacterales bacterium]